MNNKVKKDWKKILTLEQYNILRKKGTEPPFTGEYLDNKKKGLYICAACGNELFSFSFCYILSGINLSFLSSALTIICTTPPLKNQILDISIMR